MYHGISQETFPVNLNSILMGPINSDNIEIKPDGIALYNYYYYYYYN